MRRAAPVLLAWLWLSLLAGCRPANENEYQVKSAVDHFQIALLRGNQAGCSGIVDPNGRLSKRIKTTKKLRQKRGARFFTICGFDSNEVERIVLLTISNVRVEGDQAVAYVGQRPRVRLTKIGGRWLIFGFR